MANRKINPAASRVLVVSDALSDLLVLRRLVLETSHGVETARSAQQALLLVKERHFDVVVADEFGVRDGGGEHLLDMIAELEPEALLILVTHDQAHHDARMFRVARPFYAQALRALLTEHSEQQIAREQGDDTARTELWSADDLNRARA